MSKTDEKKKYSVYVHTCPDGMVYVGMTSLLPCRRYNGGEGYKGNAEFYEAIQKWGWKNIRHRVVTEFDDMPSARMMETTLISATLPEKSYNISQTGQHIMKYQDIGGVVPQFNPQTIVDALGESVNIEFVNRYSNEMTQKDIPTYFSKSGVFTNSKQQKQSDMKKEKEKARMMTWKVIKGVKIEAMLDTRYKHNCGGYPVCIRMYTDRRYRYIQTGFVMPIHEFNDMDSKSESYILKMFDHYCDRIRDYEGRITYSYIQGLPNYTQSKTVDVESTMTDLFVEKMGMLKTLNTVANYKTVIKRVLDIYPDGLPLSMVSTETIGNLMDKLKKGGLSDTTMNIYGSIIKSTINYGIYKGYLKDSQYPFRRSAVEIDKIAIPKSASRDMEYLTKEQMQQIWEWFKVHKDRYIGYFLFSYLHGGINLADILTLKFGDLYYQERAFCYRRRKTIAKNNFDIIVPATKWTDELFKVMGITPKRGELVFKEMAYDGTEREFSKAKSKFASGINRAVGALTKQLGMRDSSMTTARHTFCTIANKQRMPYSMIERAMGHANNGVSGHYIGGFTPDEMRPDFENLL